MMAFLLISMAAIVPVYADSSINEEWVNSEKIVAEQEKNETLWYKNAENLNALAMVGLFLLYSYVSFTRPKSSRGVKK